MSVRSIGTLTTWSMSGDMFSLTILQAVAGGAVLIACTAAISFAIGYRRGRRDELAELIDLQIGEEIRKRVESEIIQGTSGDPPSELMRRSGHT